MNKKGASPFLFGERGRQGGRGGEENGEAVAFVKAPQNFFGKKGYWCIRSNFEG